MTVIEIQNLQELHDLLLTAATPEEIFGSLSGTPDDRLTTLKAAYRKLARIAHPDRAPAADKSLAEKTFQLLETWRQRAESRILSRTATPDATTYITTRKATYAITSAVAQGDYFTLHRCTPATDPARKNLTLKIIRDPRDNDLAESEIRTLRTLAGSAPLRPYIPQLVDNFLATDGASRRRALIYATPIPVHHLSEIRPEFPAGLDPRDAAWMFNRLLEVLWLLHQSGLIHGAILPTNLFVNLETHGLTLTEFAHSVPIGTPLSALSAAHESWYPPETLPRAPATPATDIFMAARTLLYLVGGNPLTGQLPIAAPQSIQRFLRACLLPAPSRRPNDAGQLREEFDELLTNLYGPRTFRPFALPA